MDSVMMKTRFVDVNGTWPVVVVVPKIVQVVNV